MTRFYRFPDAAAFLALMPALPEGETGWPTLPGAAIDVCFGTGILRTPTGEVLETDDGPVDVTEIIPGFHVNVRWQADAPEGWAANEVPRPRNPKVVFYDG